MTLTEPQASIRIDPARAQMIIPLPPEFAAAWSPGFDLHVSGYGTTPDEAREDLQRNLRQLGETLLERAELI